MARSAPLPLLTWRRDAELRRLAVERQALIERIAALPAMSHRRVALTERLKDLTTRILRIEVEYDEIEPR